MTSPLQELKSMVAVVAGSSSGMGRAVARAAAGAGAKVVLAARNSQALEQVSASIEQSGGSSLAVPTDATDGKQVDHLIHATLEHFGRIDVLINSIGTNIPRRALAELTNESWSEMLAINLTAAFNLTHAVVPVLRDQGGGLIIHISSEAVKRPDRSGVAYQASKAGVAALSHGTMEEEREHGIRTTVIFAGFTDTPLVLKRPAPTPPEALAHALSPEDIAAACLFVMRLPPRAHVPELWLSPSRH